MPALMTWGGVALAVLGLLVAFLGLPDRAAGLSMGSDLLQAGASLFAGGLVVAALGQVLRGLRDVADRVEEAGFGIGAPRNSFNDDERPEEGPMPLPRAGGRNTPAEPEPVEPDAYQPQPRIAASERQPRTPRGREPQAETRAARIPAAPDARPPRQPQQPPRVAREAEPQPDEFADEMPAGEAREPRWLRAQAQANAEQPAGVVPMQQPNRPVRGPAAVPNAPRREPSMRPRQAQPEVPLDEDAPASVVRSGIIGGMAYTTYSDGSIEAELPIGTVRFNSVAELQEHVKRAGEEADGDFRGSASASQPH